MGVVRDKLDYLSGTKRLLREAINAILADRGDPLLTESDPFEDYPSALYAGSPPPSVGSLTGSVADKLLRLNETKARLREAINAELGIGLTESDPFRQFAAKIHPVLSLYQNGEQGAWYDPSDLTTLYQDSAGTTPVTADGDPVGLMLDRSQGLAAENLDESLDFSTWSESGLTVGGSAPEFVLSVPADVSAAFIVKSMTTGFFGLYTFSVTIKKGAKNWVCLSPRIGGLASSARTWFNLDLGTVGTMGNSVSSATIVSEPDGYYKCSVTVFADSSADTNSVFRIFAADADNSIQVTGSGLDDFFVKSATVSVDKKGNHATQSVSASRPIYKTAGLLQQYDGVDDAMNATLPSIPAATVITAKATGVDVQYPVDLSAGTYTINESHSGVIIREGQLSASEQQQAINYLSTQQGVA